MTACSRRGMLAALFQSLDESGVRYAVLHSYESLPDDLPSDLDLALDPADAAKLAPVFRALAVHGYLPVQCIQYEVAGYYFLFCWFEGAELRMLAVDFTFQHREGGRILMSGEELVAGRIRRGAFWTPPPATEFGYLLAKKTLKGTLPDGQAARLRQLVSELGRAEAEAVARRWFGRKCSAPVVDACVRLEAGRQMAELRRRFRRALRLRDPLNPLRYRLTDLPRLVRRWLQPVGLFVAVLGPDGAGKSTLVDEVVRQIGPAFRSARLFHWRPMLLAGNHRTATSTPHGRPPDGALRSVARLLLHFADYHLGYWLRLRPWLARSALVLFDRYFHDMLADPRRYRYGGPEWLVRLLSRLVPEPDLVLILEAPEPVILARKQEMTPEELRRQRDTYLRLREGFAAGEVIDASGAPQEVAAQALAILTRQLAARLRRRGTFFRLPGPGEEWLQLALERLRGPRTEGRSHGFAVLRARGQPRLLLPLGDRRTTLQGFEIYMPFQRRARLGKELLAFVMGTGSKIWAWNRLVAPPGSFAALEELAAEMTGEDRPAFALSLGTPSRYRKLAVQVMRPGGEILGHVKIPLTEAGEERVRHEAAVLEHLRRFPPLWPHIPSVLFAGPWQGNWILFQSAGRHEPGPAEFDGGHRRFLELLRYAGRADRPGALWVDKVRFRWARVAPRLETWCRDLGEKALGRAGRELEAVSIPCGISHGDFAPWNTRGRNGRLFVFDWEAAAWEAPVWWDEFHFDTQVASLLKKNSRLNFTDGEPPGWFGAYLLYLLASLCQAVEEEPVEPRGLEFRAQRLWDLTAGAPEARQLAEAHVHGGS